MSDIEVLSFPSGRSVGNCRKDAKRLAKAQKIPLHDALDRTARDNGSTHPWDRSIAALMAGTSLAAVTIGRRPVTTEDVRAILEKHHHLTRYGMGVPRRILAEGGLYGKEVAKGQADLLEHAHEVELCCQFLEHVEKRKSINRRGGSSYGLKHAVEHYQKRRLTPPENPYVANGSFICAAIHMGFTCREDGRGGPNVYFNMSSRSPVFEWRNLRGRQVWQRSFGAEFAKLKLLAARVGATAGQDSH